MPPTIKRLLMNKKRIEAIVRATIEQMSKKPEPSTDQDEYERFCAREDAKKMRRYLKKIGKP